jgi:hypothetical protein
MDVTNSLQAMLNQTPELRKDEPATTEGEKASSNLVVSLLLQPKTGTAQFFSRESPIKQPRLVISK